MLDRSCVYTVLTGAMRICKSSRRPRNRRFLHISDRRSQSLTSETWRITKVDPFLGMEPGPQPTANVKFALTLVIGAP